METVGWGILGTGRMAAALATEIAALRTAGVEVTAVASRSRERARAFAAQHGIHHAWDSPEDLASDPAVDAVYIATPHVLHCNNAISCLEAGKAVLCEKPFTLNAREAQRVIDAARRRGVFLMEAMWTRFLPSVVALRGKLAEGAIGRVHLVVGGGAFVPAFDPGHYLFDRELGGGVLLDAGVYLVSMASMILGPPTAVLAHGRLGQQGVDEQDAVVLGHADGSSALLYVSLHARRSPDLEILGSDGRIGVAAPVFRPARLRTWGTDGAETVQEYPIDGSGYGYQVLEVAGALRAGRTESDVMPLAESLSVMKTLDEVRRQIGLAYPGEAN
jgi:predicted dehydrogenase